MKLNFKTWLNENGTTTACIASFARPIGGMIARQFPTEEKPKKKKKKLL